MLWRDLDVISTSLLNLDANKAKARRRRRFCPFQAGVHRKPVLSSRFGSDQYRHYQHLLHMSRDNVAISDQARTGTLEGHEHHFPHQCGEAD
jgi:hypothetical protein